MFDAEIVPVEVPQRKGDPVVVDARTRACAPTRRSRRSAGLRPAFAEGGSITAGNSSQISDGAAAVVLTSRAHADENGWPVLAVVGASGQVAGPDNSLHSQPARAIAAALEKQGIARIRPRPRRDQRGVRRGRRCSRSASSASSDDVVNMHGGGDRARAPDRRIGHPARAARRARAVASRRRHARPSRCAAAAGRARR